MSYTKTSHLQPMNLYIIKSCHNKKRHRQNIANNILLNLFQPIKLQNIQTSIDHIQGK